MKKEQAPMVVAARRMPDADSDDLDKSERLQMATRSGAGISPTQPYLFVEPPRRNAGKFFVGFLIFVVLPTLYTLLYFGLIATPMYVSEARIALRSESAQTASMLGALLGSVGQSGASAVDNVVVKEYIGSHKILEELRERIDFASLYNDPSYDPFTRLKVNPSSDELLDYYNGVVKIEADDSSNTMHLSVRAYDARVAQLLGETIISLSEKMVNQLSDRAKRDAVAFAEGEVARYEARLRETSAALEAFRKEVADIDPSRSVAATMSMVAELEGELAKLRLELADLSTYMRPNSPQILSIRTKMAELERQIASEKNRLTGAEGKADTLSRYAELQLELDLSQRAYSSALASLETARASTMQQSAYLVAFVPPSLPDRALWPDLLFLGGSVFTGSLMLFLVGSLVLSIVREHFG